VREKLEVNTIAALILTIIFWGISPPGIRAALKTYSPGHVAILRFLAASLTLALYGPFAHIRLPERKDIPGLLMLGFIGTTCYHALINYGLVTVHAGAASLLVNTAPVFTALLATVLLGERLKPWGWVGMFVSLAGAALIALGQGKSIHLEPGALILLLSAVAWSLNIVLQKPYLSRYSALEVTSYSIWAGTLFLLVFLPGLVPEVRRAPIGMTLFVVYLGIFPIALAYALWAYALSRMPASRAAGFLYLIPVVVFIVAWIYLGELPSALTIFGGGIILAGVILLNGKGRAERRSPKLAGVTVSREHEMEGIER
jgi:drug/metabolite transporter (DMT)-like permease